MITNPTPRVSVDIQGDDEQATRATAAVVSEALRTHGFTHVNVENLDAEVGAPAGLDSAVSILDLARMSRPSLFSTPVDITFTSVALPPEDVSETDAEIDDAIAAADENAGIYG